MTGGSWLLCLLIGLPAAFGALCFAIPKAWKAARAALLLLGTAGTLTLVILAYGREITLFQPWVGFGIDFSLRLYHFSGFIVLAGAALSFLVAVYTVAFAKGKPYGKMLYGCMLLTLSMVNGAVLANNLVVMLFFWEAILATLFGMIIAGGKDAYKTSVKAMAIAGVTDLCMMLGIGMFGYLSKTLAMDGGPIPLTGWGAVAFLLLMVGALSKAGAMPFHTWIPDAARDAPLPFMTFLPGALEKLLGVYLLCRICLDLFTFIPGSAMSYTLMLLGAGTILFGVMMALVQKDFKRLLAYHAISQVGYMVLGIGTGLPVGIVGGLFHMLNNAVYKCGLFMAAGAVEKQTGTTDLHQLGGLWRKMPVTFLCFLVAALSIAGFPITNGFFSKELVFDAAIESNLFFYIIAAIGALFTPISFLKLGHAAFFGKPTSKTENVREAPMGMLLPMVALAASCLALGFGNSFVIRRVLEPILGTHAEAGQHIGGHTNWLLVGISAALLLFAAVDHYLGFRRTGKGLSAADHYHYAPGLKTVYGWAEKKYFDPYERLRGPVGAYGRLCLAINNGVSWCYDVLAVRVVRFLSSLVRRAHNGNQARYVLWVLSGVVVVAVIFLLS